MTDVFSLRKRRSIMQAIGCKNSFAEVSVRSVIHRMGFRFRLQDKDLPGTPDIVFSARRKVVFVHGCFWHRHNCRKGRSMPSTREAFWREKLAKNKSRDTKQLNQLRRLGWKSLVIWECQIRPTRMDQLAQELRDFLDG